MADGVWQAKLSGDTEQGSCQPPVQIKAALANGVPGFHLVIVLTLIPNEGCSLGGCHSVPM
jgi:hypothetical protein